MTVREIGFAINILTAICVCLNVLLLFRYRRIRYRDGWLDGRARMIQSLDEALRRDMSLEDWVRSMAEEDGVRMAGHGWK